MLFPTHLAAAYVLGERWDLSAPLLVAGAALPDLVDKPAAMLNLVDLYQTAGHSLAVLAAGFAVVFLRRAWTPLWLGWASHLALDAVHMIVNGRPGDLLFLAWPTITHVPAVSLPPVAFARHYVGTPSFALEFVVWGVLAAMLLGRRRPTKRRDCGRS
ncbi:metal-dependent hydrolase [Haloplanus salilacus]|uniref:metal-dependent hydrolase n=1 Tax=Haloplanus salilacus TaxID=2949994 RepID=UPI0030CD778F